MRSRNQAHRSALTGKGAYLGTSSESFWRKVSVVKSLVESPMMANCLGKTPSLARLKSAGMSLRLVRSPPAPKMTMMQGPAALLCSGMGAGLVDISSTFRIHLTGLELKYQVQSTKKIKIKIEIQRKTKS